MADIVDKQQGNFHSVVRTFDETLFIEAVTITVELTEATPTKDKNMVAEVLKDKPV